MCRNITILRGLDPPFTDEEVDAAALQYVRKVAGISSLSSRTAPAVDAAVEAIAEATRALLEALPPRSSVPKSLPPLRRLAATR